MTIPGAHLNGVILDGEVPEAWRLQAGVHPAMLTVTVPESAVPGLLEIPRAQATLTLGSRVVKKLSVIGRAESPNAYVGAVTLADDRYWWGWGDSHVHLHRNVRRRTGLTTRGQWNDVLRPGAVGTLDYKRYSVKASGRPYDGVEILRDVFRQMGIKAPLLLDQKLLRKIPIENLFLDHLGDQAVAQALERLPGFDVTVDPDGRVVVFNWGSGAERAVVGTGSLDSFGQMGPETADRGHIVVNDNRPVRPGKIVALYTPEFELRFNALDLERVSDSGSIERAGPQQLPPMEMQNVGPVSDWALVVNGQRIGQGTYLPIYTQLQTWRNAIPGALLSQLSDKMIRRAFVPGRGGALWAAMQAIGVKDAANERAEWNGRIAMLQQHYRQTYQLPTDWIDMIQELRPYLAATIDRTSGQRAPARVYSDHCVIASTKALYQQTTGKQFYGTNISGYPGDDLVPGEDERPAPVSLTIEDQDQGVIRFNYQLDPFGLSATVLPSHIVPMPERNLRQGRKTPLTFDSYARGGTPPQLSPTSRAAAFFTAIPAHVLYAVEVKPNDVRDLLPEAARKGLNRANGPTMYIRIPPTFETARFAWGANSSRAQVAKPLIEQAFREGRIPNQLRAWCINDAEQSAIGERAASLRAIARGHAAAVWASFVDRPIGAITAPLQDIRVRGAIWSVTHQLSPDGAIETTAALRPQLPRLNPMTYIPDDVQRVAAKTVY